MSVIITHLSKLLDLDISHEEGKELRVLREGALIYLELNERYRGKIIQRHSDNWYKFIQLLSDMANYHFDLFASYLTIFHPIFNKANSYRNFLVFNNNMVISQLKAKFYREIPGEVCKIKDKNVNDLRLYWLGKEIIFNKKENTKLKSVLYEFYLYLLTSSTFIYIPSSKKGLFADFSFENKNFFSYFYRILTKEDSKAVLNLNTIDKGNTNEKHIEKFIMNLTPFYLFHFLKFNKAKKEKEEFDEGKIPDIYGDVTEFLADKEKNKANYYLEPLLFCFSLKLKKFWELYKELKFTYNQEIPWFSKELVNYMKHSLKLINRFYKIYSNFRLYPVIIYAALFDKDVQIINRLYRAFENVSLKEDDIKKVGIVEV